MLRVDLVDEIYLTRLKIKTILRSMKQIQRTLMLQLRENYKNYAYISAMKKNLLTDINYIRVEVDHLEKFID